MLQVGISKVVVGEARHAVFILVISPDWKTDLIISSSLTSLLIAVSTINGYSRNRMPQAIKTIFANREI